MLTRGQLFTAMTRCVGILIPAVIGGSGGAEHDPLSDVYTGEQARERIVRSSVQLNRRRDGGPLPASATNFYMFDGGSFNGTIEYWSFECGTLDDCWSALASVGGPDKDEFK